jgi:ubiquinone biosynthesis protein
MEREDKPPVSLEKGTLQRLRQIVQVLIRHGFFDVVQRLRLLTYLPLSSRLVGKKFTEETKVPPAIRLRVVLTELGPTFIKLGQFLSTRSDILPREVINEFEKLQDRVPPVPFPEIKKQLRKGLGCPIEKVFSSVDSTPLGTASIGQVHRATLLSGKKVVVKVQRPGVEKTIKDDIRLMTFLAGLLERYFPDESSLYTPTEIVKQFSRMINRELDYKKEARNSENVRHCFEGDKDTYIPVTHLEYTTKYVLVQDYVVGRKLSGVSRKALKKDTIKKIVTAYTRQVLEFGLFQADPHLGNIFLRKNGSIGIIDFGAVGSVDNETREKLGEWFSAITRNDINGVVAVLFNVGAMTLHTGRGYLKEDITEFMHNYGDCPVEEIDVERVYVDLIEIIRRNRIRVPPTFLLLMRMLASMEGMVRKFDPDFNLIVFLKPHLDRLEEERNRPEYVVSKTMTKLSKLEHFADFISPMMLNILEKASRGTMKFEVDYVNLDREVSKLDLAINKIALSGIIAALIIGSSLILVSDKEPLLFGFPALGVVGMTLAALLGTFVVVRILHLGRI